MEKVHEEYKGFGQNWTLTTHRKTIKKQKMKLAWKDTKIHECGIWQARDKPHRAAGGRGGPLWVGAACRDHKGWRARCRDHASTEEGRERAGDKKQQGHRERCQMQVKIFWKGPLLFCQNFEVHFFLELLSICIWQKWLKVGLHIYPAID